MSSQTDSLTNAPWFPSGSQARPWVEHPLLWALALLAMVGDATTTWYGLQQGLQEANPVAETVLHVGGFPAMWVMKLAALTLTAAAQSVLSGRYTAAAPAIPAAMWGFAATSNAVLILVV